MAPNHRDNLAQHIHISSADDLSYSVSPSSGINDTIQTIVTGRKCWKTMKGKGEVVWPPYLEAALVEGLEKYQPVESRTSRSFGRFPMRNKFISDYIFQVTGKRRTPKQVGSRLQQLRDTTEGKRILQQLSSRHMAMMQPKGANQSRADAERASSNPASSSPSTSSPLSASGSSSASTQPARVPTSYVSIDVLPDPGTPPPLRLPSLSSPLVPSAPAPSTLASFVHTPSSPNSGGSGMGGMGLGLNASGPRVLRHVDPTVTFMSRAALQACSSFKVTKTGSGIGTEVHTEKTELELLSSSCMPGSQWSSEIECTFLYRTQFVPRFWETLCRSPDPSAYTVLQEIVRSGSGSGGGEGENEPHAPEDVLLSIVYQFNNVSATPPLSPDSTSNSTTFSTADASRPGTAGSHFSGESTPELHSELDDLMMFNCPLDVPVSVPSLSHSLPHAHAPPLVHADEDAYASLPPTPTSPFDLAPPGAHWHHGHHGHGHAHGHGHGHPHPHHGAHGHPHHGNHGGHGQEECGRGMYGLGGMGMGAVGDVGAVAIAGTGTGGYMNSYLGQYAL